MKKNLPRTRQSFCIAIILFFSILNASFAQTYTWVGSVDNNYYNVNNWDNVAMTFPNSNLIIGAGNPNNPTNVGLATGDNTTKRPSSITTNSDADIIVTGALVPNNDSFLNGIITLNNNKANFNIRKNTYLGKEATATLNINAGSINSNLNFYIGYGAGGNAMVNVNAGTLSANANLELATGAGSPTANLNITGGTVSVKTNLNIGANGQIFISGLGQLYMTDATGDKRSILQAYVDSGKIKCNSIDRLQVTWDGTKTWCNIYTDPNRMIQEFPDYIILRNGTVEAKIHKNTSDILSLKVNGVETISQTGSKTKAYHDFTTNNGFETIYGATFSIKEETADYIDVSFKRPYSPGNNIHPCDADIHYVLKRKDKNNDPEKGLYVYSILEHKATYPDFDLGSWRQVMWLAHSDTDLLEEKIFVTDLKKWQMPKLSDTYVATGIAEIVKYTSGIRDGKYDGKYQYCENLFDLPTYGHASDINSIGSWVVFGSHEFFNGGPTSQDLNAAAGLLHICMNGLHYQSGGLVAKQGEEWSKIYGPYLIYTSTKATADLNWEDSKNRAAQEEAEWPYSWLTNTPQYPLANERGNITGTFSIKDPYKPLVTGKNAWIGVTQLSGDSKGKWQYESKNYHYWVKTDVSGNFDIKNVRPGTYTLFAYSDGVTGEYSMTNVTVTAGGTNNLGTVEWSIPRTNGNLVWEIGVPNRSTSEYKFGDFEYCEGYVQKKFNATFPNPIEYNVADKNWSSVLPYVHSKYYDANGDVLENWKWRFNFELPAGMPTTGTAKLTIAYAGSDSAQQQIYINSPGGTAQISYYPAESGGNAFVRQSNHAKYSVKVVDIDMSKLHAGSNYIQFIMPSNSGNVSNLMYDYISFEAVLNPNDLDNDGVVNANDVCPNTLAGETVNSSGCSQSQLDDDNDGVKNNIDTCANTPTGATVNAFGCSTGQLDDDNDGVMNNLDTCPNTPSGQTVNSSGCSQSQLDDDNDGVKNNQDTCDNTPTGATVNASGCSTGQLDDDSDGVNNSLDTCPNTPTGQTVNSSGCAQSQLDDDNDGVKNNIDTCANTPTGATVNTSGCSTGQLDDDNDGVINNLDTCPNTTSGQIVNASGCAQSQLDDDNDGVKNNLDTCPNTPTGQTVNAFGCAQSQLDDDSDGVKNSLDTCPNTPTGEAVNSSGCSQIQLDDDNDGVKNNLDTCANTPIGQTVNSSGCSQSQLDDDNDGVMNNLDTCPNTPSGQLVNSTGCVLLPSNNFNIEVIGESCPNKNNGQIKISATTSYNYVATINGVNYNLANNNLTVMNLIPGTYNICINVAGKIAEQCYSVEIKAGTSVTGKSTITSNKTNVEIVEGTAPYKVMVNGKLLFTTMSKTFDVINQPGDVIEVKTAVECEGVFSKIINSVEEIIAYPNPTKGLFEIAIPSSLTNVTVELYNLKMQMISRKSYPVHYGKIQLSIENQAQGVYFAKVEMVNPVTLKIIKE